MPQATLTDPPPRPPSAAGVTPARGGPGLPQAVARDAAAPGVPAPRVPQGLAGPPEPSAPEPSAPEPSAREPGAPRPGIAPLGVAAPGMTLERILLWALLGGIAAGCAVVLWPFLSAVLWAAILVFATWPVFVRLRRRLRLPRAAAALVMVVLTAVLTALPLALLAPNGAQDVATLQASAAQLFSTGLPAAPHWLYRLPVVGHPLTDNWNAWAADLGKAVAFFRPYFGMIAEDGLAVLLGVADGVVRFVLALFIAFFFWMSGDAIGTALRGVLGRIAGPRAEGLIALTGRTVRGTVYGVLGTALLQGVLTACGLWMVAIPRPVLWGALAAFLAVLPIGAPLVWIPAGIWLLLDGSTTRGIVLLVYGTLVVSGADHILRPMFIARGAQLPFLLTVLGVLGGVLGFGVLGIFVGPVLLSVGYTLVLEFARSAAPAPDPG